MNAIMGKAVHDGRPVRSTRGVRTGVPKAIGFGVALLLLWWALRDVDLTSVVSQVRNARLLPLAGGVALVTMSLFPLRAIRWRYMLQPRGQVLRFVPLFHATAVGTLTNYLLPARVGELARAYAARELAGSPFSTAFGSIVAERIIDGLATVGMLAVAFVLGEFGTGQVVGAWSLGNLAAATATAFGFALLALVCMVRWPEQSRRASRKVFGALLPACLAVRAEKIVSGIIAGFDALNSPRRMLATVAWTVILWCVSATGMWFGLFAFGIAVPWSAALMVQAVIALAAALPSTPGFIGPFEAAARASLALCAVNSSQALAFSAPFHLLAYYVPVMIVGVWSLGQTGLRIAELRRRGVKAAGSAPAA